MKIKTRLKANYSKEELEKAEILEGYTRLLSGEKLSRKQKKLLHSHQHEYEEELAPLKNIIDFAHRQSAMMMASFMPSPIASQRVETNLMSLIKGLRPDSRRPEGNQIPTPDLEGNLQPAYDIEPVGSDTELAQMEYEYGVAEEFISQEQQKRDCILQFEIVEGDEIGRKYLVAIPPILGRGKDAIRGITIGRGLNAQIRLPDSSGELSRVHAKLEAHEGDIYITDLNSSNGTYVDGEEITGSHKLSIGSTVRLGGVVIKILSITFGAS